MANAVTVLLPVYNGQLYLVESIESILQQSYANFELLVIDDGSTDNSVEIVSKYRDSRIRLIRHSKNQGLVRTLNHGLAEARNELIARHDADDIAYPERFKFQIEVMNFHPEIGVCGSGAYIVSNGQKKKKILFPSSDVQIRWALPFYCPLIHPSIMYRRSVVGSVSGYSIAPEANYCEDYELWIKLLPFTKFYNINRPLMDLRKHHSNMTVAKRDFHIQQTTKLIKQYVDKQLKRNVPIDLIRWLQNAPNTPASNRRTMLILNLYKNYISQNRMAITDYTKVTASAGVQMVRALKDDLFSKVTHGVHA